MRSWPPVDHGDKLVVLGFDQGWASSRPLWNQHSYHITNINDDLSVPPREPDSWAYHNTYRTQSPLDSPAPVHYIEVSHTIAPSMTVVPGSFSRAYTDVNPVYRWGYSHYWYEPPRDPLRRVAARDAARARSAG